MNYSGGALLGAVHDLQVQIGQPHVAPLFVLAVVVGVTIETFQCLVHKDLCVFEETKAN